MRAAEKEKRPCGGNHTSAEQKSENEKARFSASNYTTKMEVLQMCTYLAMLALGFALGAAFTAAGMLAERKGARR